MADCQLGFGRILFRLTRDIGCLHDKQHVIDETGNSIASQLTPMVLDEAVWMLSGILW